MIINTVRFDLKICLLKRVIISWSITIMILIQTRKKNPTFGYCLYWTLKLSNCTSHTFLYQPYIPRKLCQTVSDIHFFKPFFPFFLHWDYIKLGLKYIFNCSKLIWCRGHFLSWWQIKSVRLWIGLQFLLSSWYEIKLVRLEIDTIQTSFNIMIVNVMKFGFNKKKTHLLL